MYDALVLAGGAARRLGGVDKPALVLDGLSLLDRVLRATVTADLTVVVGPERAVLRPVVWARENPVGGGPAAALAAGLAHVRADLVVLLAADLPWVTQQAVADLVARVGSAGRAGRDGTGLRGGAGSGDEAYTTDGTGSSDGAVVRVGGHPQWLCSAWRTTSVSEAVRGRDLAGSSLRGVLQDLQITWVDTAPEGTWRDCDTPADLADLMARGERRTR